jgi:HEAT repeat protein
MRGSNPFFGIVERLKIPSERHAACRLLAEGKLGARASRGLPLPEQKVDALLLGLAHPNAAVRRCCLELLDTHPTARAVPHILPLLDDPVPRVRWHAAHALGCDTCKGGGSLMTPEIAAELARVADADPSAKVRAEAARALAELGNAP